MVILGIDPGTATTGFGVIKAGKGLRCLDYGLIQTEPCLAAGERLRVINKELNKLTKKYEPEALAVESLYFFKNMKTALPVSQAKGVVLLTAAQKKIPVHEFTPLQAKMAVAGYGKAEKKQVQEMIKIILNLKKVPKPDDAADALAVAICCARNYKGLDNLL